MALLAANLRMVDEAGLPVYLEASNVANVPLYQRYGFVVHGSFRMPEGGPEVVTMGGNPGRSEPRRAHAVPSWRRQRGGGPGPRGRRVP